MGPTIPGVSAATLPRFLLDLTRAVAGKLRQADRDHTAKYCTGYAAAQSWATASQSCCLIASTLPMLYPAAGTLKPDKLPLAVRCTGVDNNTQTHGEDLADAFW